MQLISFAALFVLYNAFLPQSANKPWHLTGYAQGTNWNVTYYAPDSMVAVSTIDSIFSVIDSSLSIYKPYSLISRFNRSAQEIKTDEHLRTVISKSIQIYRQTGGAFDVTVMPLVNAWGFGTTKITEIPSKARIDSLMRCIGSNQLRVNAAVLIKEKPCLQIDVNGIAQGYTVDVIASELEKKNIQNYLVELGGEIRVKGVKTGGAKMTIGIEAPGDDTFVPLPMRQVIRPGDGAITTSGNYRKHYEVGGKKISHLIDAKTGYPVNNELISVTVFAKNAMTADGFDNALMNMGLKKGLHFVKKHPEIAAYFIYQKPGGVVADTASANFPKFEGKPVRVQSN